VRDTSGDVAIWLMSGTAILSGAIVANVSTARQSKPPTPMPANTISPTGADHLHSLRQILLRRIRSLMAHRVESLRCEGSDAIGAKRTCRERRERLDPTKMTHLRHWLCTAAMVLIPGLTPIKVHV
jgi:hypothetical protein